MGSFAVSSVDLAVAPGTTRVPTAGDTSCFGCSTLLTPGTSLISSPSNGASISSISMTTVSTNNPVSVVIDSNQFLYYSYTPAAGVSSITVNFENVEYSAFDFGAGLAAVQNLRFEFDSLPYTVGCGNTCVGMSALTTSCTNSFNSITINNCNAETIYFTIAYCGTLTCPIEFDLIVEENNTPAVFVSVGTHQSAYTRMSSVAPDDCQTASPNLSFYTTVSDILLVSVRQPGSNAGAFSVGVDVSTCAGFSDSCSASTADAGIHSSCSVPTTDCSSSHCMTPGTYQITFTPGAAPYEFEYQVITQYVDLSSSASGTIIGDTAHFYRITDSSTALSIALTITRGPGLNFAVLESASANMATQSVNQIGEVNVDYEKETVYSLSVTRGAANCGATPSTGFCADPTRAGINVWSDVSNNVWTFGDVSGRDNQAECLYNDLVDRCVAPSVECKQFLKAFACVTTFPQCDTDGYQMGVCNDLCLQVEDVCVCVC